MGLHALVQTVLGLTCIGKLIMKSMSLDEISEFSQDHTGCLSESSVFFSTHNGCGDNIRVSNIHLIYIFSGPVLPQRPVELIAYLISHDQATVQWKVPSVLYTPETYKVQYRTKSSDLYETKFTMDTKVALFELLPNTDYYFQVIAQNTVGQTESYLSSFRTTFRKFTNDIFFNISPTSQNSTTQIS